MSNPENEIYVPSEAFSIRSHVKSMTEYKSMWTRSVENPDQFWADVAKKYIDFFVPFTQVHRGDLVHGDVAWFLNGKLNACYNCVDRHLADKADQVAILWEADEPGVVRKVTYLELYYEVCKLANALKKLGIRKGDVICIYMPMVPEAVVAMLACARIGAIHTVVFAGFSVDSIRDRVNDGQAVMIITGDEVCRGGKKIPLKPSVDEAVKECPTVRKVLVYKHTGTKPAHWEPKRDVWWHDVVPGERPYCPPELMDSEDYLFTLYTSGSTGKPKGLAHSTAGYLVYAAFTHKLVFDYQDGDVFGCVADIGWITGHSYIVYGPLANGATTFMFEGIPTYPDAGRYWDLVQRHKITTFYTSPTAIRTLMKSGDEPVKKYDRSSLRLLGSVGEPINPEAWRWLHRVVGDSKLPIVDTYWQTETGGIIMTPVPGAIPLKPGSCTLPFFGISPVVLDAQTGKEIHGNGIQGVLALKGVWPGMARTVYGDHPRYLVQYLTQYKGYYFTGDGVNRDKDGYYWVTGRVDDVMNVSGHRIGSAEVESALVAHPRIAEAAVIGVPHDVKGTSIFAYVTPKDGDIDETELEVELKLHVRNHLGAFARPDHILCTPALPKTRSGKIMRRILRKIASKEYDIKGLGDITTLADPSVVEDLIKRAQALYARAEKHDSELAAAKKAKAKSKL